MNLGVRTKVVLITVTILSLAIGASSLIGSAVFMNEYTETLQSEILVVGRGLRLQLDKLLNLGITLDELVGFESQCQDVVNEHEELSYAMVVNTDGEILFHSDPSQHGKTLTAPALLQAVKGTDEVVQVYSEQGERFYDATIPVFGIHDEHVGAIRVGFPNSLVVQKTHRLSIYYIGVAILSLGLGTMLLLFSLSIWVTQPLSKLLAVINTVRNGTLISPNLRVEINSDDEIGQLGLAFNQMLADLEESQKWIRRYTLELEETNEQLRRDVTARQQAEKALEKAYAEVEQQVEERTHELQQEITEHERTETELQRYRDHLEDLVIERTRELEEAQAELVRQERLSALGQLTATVAHEIRNPLGTVRTSVFSIEDAIKRDEFERIERALQLAERNIVRCDTIISELLDYTRYHVLRPSLTDIDGWLDRLLDEMLNQQSIPETIACIRELNANIEIPVDTEHLRRAVINIVNNAVDAMREVPGQDRNQLTIKTLVIDERLEIHVSDTGCGIPDEMMNRLFEPLFSTKSFGIGLGLPIAKGIMEQHGGGIEVSSQRDKGTTIVLWLPRVDGL
jgi:signal transduction histidine kinase